MIRPTFFICFAGFTQTMLFDERKNPYHLMLRDLVNVGGLDAFFKTFVPMITETTWNEEETGDLTSALSEFLDSWLPLLEKMVNPRMIIDSPHSMAPKQHTPVGYQPFDVTQYLITVHKRAFSAVEFLWQKRSKKCYSDQTSEHILSILCHILKGESIISENLKKENESATGSNATPSGSNPGASQALSRTDYPGLNEDQLQQLVDMGFAREAVIDALMQCQTIEQATEFLLSTPQASSNWTARPNDANIQDVDMATEEVADNSKSNKPPEGPKIREREEPLSKEKIDSFTDNLLPGALRLMDELPSTVYKVCDLILTVSQRNGETWCSSLLRLLLDDIVDNVKKLLDMAKPLRAKDKISFSEWTTRLRIAPEANKVAVRIHLYSLIFDEMKINCANYLHNNNAIDCLISLLEVGLDLFSLSRDYTAEIGSDVSTQNYQTPKWLAPTMLLIDLYERGAVASSRRAPLVNNKQRTWQYFDERSSRWTPHAPANNKIIDDAYKNGEQCVRYSVGRKNYIAQFSSMMQFNEETQNARPIMMTLSPLNKPLEEKDIVPIVPRLMNHQSKLLIRICVGLLKLPIDPNSLQAVMRLSFRLTRNYELAVLFAELGGIRALQTLPGVSQFNGFVSLATFIIRHTLEEPLVLNQTMEKVMRSTTQHCQHNQREVSCLLRNLGSAACRNEEIFKKLATEILRITRHSVNRRDEDDSRVKTDGPQFIKLLPPKPSPEPIKPSQVTRCLIADLLDSLTVPIYVKPFDGSNPSVRPNLTPTSPINEIRITQDLPRSPANILTSTIRPTTSEPCKLPQSELLKQHNPLMNHSIVLRLLAELTRSYSVVPKIIAEHVFTPSTNESITEDTSALAFILDNILPATQTHSDRDGPPLARVFLAALAACNHCVEAQIAVVNEVKASLNRAANMSESCEKHARLQSIATMIGTMIDCCPAVAPQQPGSRQNGPNSNQQRLSNNIVRLFVRKGIVTDLARIPHSLDLSAPHMYATVNAILKPLDTLSRFVNLHSQSNQARNSAPTTKKACSTSSSSSEINDQSANATINMDATSNVPRINDSSRPMQVTVSNDTSMERQPEGNSTIGDVSMLVGSNDASADVSMVNAPTDQPFIPPDRDDNSDNVVIEAQVQFDVFNDDHQMHRRGENIGDENAHDQDFEAEHHVVVRPISGNELSNEPRDNVINSNGAESESGDDSRSDDDDDDDEEDNGEVSGVDEREEDAEDEDDDDDDDEDDDDHVDDDEDHVDDDEADDDEINASGENQFDDYRIYHNENLGTMLDNFEEVFLNQSTSVLYSDRIANIIPGVYEAPLDQHENSTPSLPPPPGVVGLTHPMLLRRFDAGPPNSAMHAPDRPSVIASTRGHRYPRPRILGGPPSSAGPRWHNGAAIRQPQTILQQLLGPNTVQEVISLTNQIVGPGRLLVADFHHWFHNDDDIYQEVGDHSLATSQATAISTIPLVMSRWSDEAKILDGDSLYDCLTNLKLEILPALEKFEEEENLERQEKRKKVLEEDEQAHLKKCKEPESQQTQTQPQTQTQTPTQPQIQPQTPTQPTVSQRSSESNPIWTQQPTIPEELPLNIPVLVSTPPSVDTAGPSQDSSSLPAVSDDNQGISQPSDHSSQAAPEAMQIVQSSLEDNPRVAPPVPQVELNQAANESTVEQTSSQSNISNAERDVPLDQPMEHPCSQPNEGSTVPLVQNDPQQGQMESNSTSNPPETSTNETTANGSEGVIPEGVDPSFLAALPEDIRQEVLAEQWRLRRLEQANANRQASSNTTQPNEQASTSSGTAFPEVNPEFLAALPVEVQEEVLAQQRAEQQRQAALNSNPDQPVDPANFIQTLAPPLRRQVLADMDDSLLSLLPPDLSAEAQALRRELLTSNASANSTLSRLLRTAAAGRMQRARYTIASVPDHHPHRPPSWGWAIDSTGPLSHGSNSLRNLTALTRDPKLRGRQLLDCEALTCLIILLFVEEPKLNIARLHRVMRNLSYHQPTRRWVVQSLLSIIERGRTNEETNVPPSKGSNDNQTDLKLNNHSSWMSISMDAALGCKASVFSVRKNDVSTFNEGYTGRDITIHHQAAASVCRHILEALIALAKTFANQFFPEPLQSNDEGENDNTSIGPDFWEVLAKLDTTLTNSNKRSKSASKHCSGVGTSNSQGTQSESQHEKLSPLAKLMGFLSHPVIRRSHTLTDRLLHLLAVISTAFPMPLDHVCEPWHNQPNPRSGNYFRRTFNMPGPSHHYPRHLHSHRPVSAHYGSSSRALPVSRQPQEVHVTADSDRVAPVKSTKKNVTQDDKPTQPLVAKPFLKLAVDVLTSKSCSEEGLDDVTNLLSRLSRACPLTKTIVLDLLMEGARQLGHTVCEHISTLKEELQDYNHKARTKAANSNNDNSSPNAKGVVQDRFTSDSVIITAPSNSKNASREVQLPSMAVLTSKNSSQAFFLRILKVIIHLRDAPCSVTSNQTTASQNQQPQAQQQSNATEATPTETSQNDRSAQTGQSAMDVDPSNQQVEPAVSTKVEESSIKKNDDSLSIELQLDNLWETLSQCLLELAETPDHHAVLVLQPAVEAFFLVHSPGSRRRQGHDDNVEKNSQTSHIDQEVAPISPIDGQQIGDNAGTSNGLSYDTQRFLKFAETHRIVLNHILRQSGVPLSQGPFAVLVDHTRVLDFDVKRRYFRQELDRLDEGIRRDDLGIHVRRDNVFEESFRELHRRMAEEWKNRFFVVFEDEEGQDAGGLLREWYTIISREIFNPMYALFTTSPGDRVTYMINSSSHCNSNHLSYFKFVGRVIAKAIYDNKLLDCYFTRSFYKHILGKPVKYTDMESEDYSFYQGLVFLLEHDVKELGYDLTFSLEVREFGVTEVRELKPNGSNIQVTEENKHEYVRLVCQEKMTGSIRKQLNAFLEGFYDIIPKRLISIFNEQELELLISGLPNIDIDDLKASTEYHKYLPNSLQIQWFWRALRSFDQADRAKLLQFVTGTSKVPLQGFASLEGMNGVQKFQIHRDERSTDRLPSAHTCFNQLDLPVYETYDKLRYMLLKAIQECSEGFGLA